jgi:C-terminal processing protease CtpA/Prc
MGIGVEVSRRNGALILTPIPGSLAQQAGVRPGDTRVRVDGQDVSNMPIEQVAQLVRGPIGTTVTLAVLHPGESTLSTITVTRHQVTVPGGAALDTPLVVLVNEGTASSAEIVAGAPIGPSPLDARRHYYVRHRHGPDDFLF